MKEILTACCTGHRPQGFPFIYGGSSKKYFAYLQLLRKIILKAINEYGVTHFISGMAEGVDLDFAEIVLSLRRTYKTIRLECAIPYSTQNCGFHWESYDRYIRILKLANEVNYITKDYQKGCCLKRDRYMVDKSDFVIAVYNGQQKGGTYYTINYAKQLKRPIEILNLNDI